MIEEMTFEEMIIEEMIEGMIEEGAMIVEMTGTEQIH